MSTLEYDLREVLEGFGAAPRRVRMLDAPDLPPKTQLDYADLIGRRGDGGKLSVDAVIVSDEHPVVYVVGRPFLPPADFDDRVQALRRALACRGRSAFLAVAERGRLTVFPCGIVRGTPRPLLTRAIGDPDSPGLLQRLVDGFDAGRSSAAEGREERTRHAAEKNAHDVLLTSITRVAAKLHAGLVGWTDPRRSELVLCLVGRALLVRYLCDRGLLPDDAKGRGALARGGPGARAAFDTDADAADACRWLDATFNGDLLQLPLEQGYAAAFAEIRRRDPTFFRSLGALMRAEDLDQLRLPLWDKLDFAYVPVGLLSEVYDDFTRRFSPRVAKSTSVHFTPAIIAEFIVDQAMGALETAHPADAVALDPAVGAGIFLTIAFRNMYAARWKRCLEEGGARPDTAVIRSILYGQLRGFDINPDALNLAALSLYLTAIELDPSPTPLHKLRFEEPLMGNVLFDVRDHAQPELGSLRPGAMAAFRGKCDLLLGNPPWTAASGDLGSAINAAADEVAEEALAEAPPSPIRVRHDRPAPARPTDRPGEPYRNPDNVPDLPFVWQSMLWAKSGATLAFALHGRLLFRATGRAVAARKRLFAAITVTGILDGSAISGTRDVWPGVNVPFCILFASNRPNPGDRKFQYASPLPDMAINRTGRFRLDPGRVHLVSPGELAKRPTMLKTLSSGDDLDLSLLRKLSGPMGDRGRTTVADLLKRHGFASSSGFQTGNSDEKRRDATHIAALRGGELTGDGRLGLLVQSSELPEFRAAKLQWPRKPEIYSPPLLLIREAVKQDMLQLPASLALGGRPVIYSEAFTGYYLPPGRPGRPRPDATASAHVLLYVAAMLASPAFRYVMLMTSSKYGVERRAVNKYEIGGFLLPDPAFLPGPCGSAFERLAAVALRGVEPDREEVEAAAHAAYGLDEYDLAVMRETLSVVQPTAAGRREAERPPTPEELREFKVALQETLDPMTSLLGASLRVEIREDLRATIPSWAFLEVRGAGSKDGEAPGVPARLLAAISEREGCTSITEFGSEPGTMRIGMPAQRRFWLPTRACLEAQGILEALDGWIAAGIAA